MGLTAGIIGLPNVGKSTLFNAITKANILSANYPFATIEPNIGVVEVKDERLDKIVEVVKPRNVVYTDFSFTDIAGLVKGASHGEGLGNQFLSHIRKVDAICHIVRCFDNNDITHVSGKVDPVDDIETINFELGYADLEIVEKRLPRIIKRASFKTEKDIINEVNVLNKIKESLELGIPIRDINLTSVEKTIIKPFDFLTAKPMIYVLNVTGDDVNEEKQYIEEVSKIANGIKTIVINAKIEEEINELSKEEQVELCKELGIFESGLDRLIKETYSLLGLQTFFTAGEQECRAWTFKKGSTAYECAGIIHTDFQRGFICAEVTSYDDFKKYGNLKKAKEAGKMRLEGKNYIFQDGDIVLFRFNV